MLTPKLRLRAALAKLASEKGDIIALENSLIVSVQRRGHDLHAYLQDLLARLPALTNQSELTPAAARTLAAAEPANPDPAAAAGSSRSRNHDTGWFRRSRIYALGKGAPEATLTVMSPKTRKHGRALWLGVCSIFDGVALHPIAKRKA
ncbi:MAG: transposase domain-containing protein [Undibacterium sp.]|nr:transposase domain-containing protein [Opitutaceae bacterium]